MRTSYVYELDERFWKTVAADEWVRRITRLRLPPQLGVHAEEQASVQERAPHPR